MKKNRFLCILVKNKQEEGRIKLFIFCYNTILVIIYTLALASNVIAYSHTKKKQNLYEINVFLFFIIDVSIVYIAEFFHMREFQAITSAMITYPGLKTFIGIMIAGLYLGILLELLKVPWKKIHFLVLGFFLIFECFVVMLPRSILQVWSFYTIRQAYLIGYALYYFYFSGHTANKEDKERLAGYRSFFIMVLIFGVLILIEDTFIIPNLNIKEAYLPYINERNLNEEIFSIVLSVLAIGQAFVQIKPAAFEDGKKEPLTVTEFPSLENDSQRIKEQAFCNAYSLTKREKDIFELLITDHSNQEISEALFISIGTVKTHVHNIYQKTGSSRKNELIRMFQNFEE